MGYKKDLLDEVEACYTYIDGLSYQDVWNMPTYRRRYFLIKKQNAIIDAEEERGNSSHTTKTGKYTQTTTMSGNALRNQINDGKIPY